MTGRKTIILAIRNLDIGGAERQFLEIAKNLDKAVLRLVVITLKDGALDSELDRIEGLERVNFRKKSKCNILFIWQFLAAIRRIKPDAIYSFMWDMNVFSAFCVILSRIKTRVVWGIFGSEPDFNMIPSFGRPLFWLQRMFESRVDLITSDSYQGFAFLKKFRFKLSQAKVIHSGTTPSRFKRDEKERISFRKKYGIINGDIAICICSRLVHMKGYPILAAASSKILREFKNVRFFSIGYGDDLIMEECKQILHGQNDRFTWLGKQFLPETIYSGCDIYCSSSIYGEGFSNSIIEAMCCELPCVVTDVGDARRQVGDCGIVVTPSDPEALHKGLREMITIENRERIGLDARRRILENFTSLIMVKNTEQTLTDLINGVKVPQLQL